MTFISARRKAAFLAYCPRCGVPPGLACQGTRHTRKSVHRERLKAQPAPADDVARMPSQGMMQ